MSITTLAFMWLGLLTFLVLILLAISVYLYRTTENTRLDTMALRARLNTLSDKGNPFRVTKKPFIPKNKEKIEIDLTQLEVIDDDV